MMLATKMLTHGIDGDKKAESFQKLTPPIKSTILIVSESHDTAIYMYNTIMRIHHYMRA